MPLNRNVSTPAAAAFAAAPPADALKLSEIVAKVEAHAAADLAYVDEVDWDDDGYWKVEYKTQTGAEVEEADEVDAPGTQHGSDLP